MTARIISLLFALVLVWPAAADSLREYTWLTIGKPSGTQLVHTSDAGLISVSFEFNDRGRGPETESVYRLNENGVPVELEITGKNYSKGAVDEHFSANDGSAKWQSNIEQGNAEFDGEAFFMPNNGAPAMLAILARAILETASGQLDLLPTGHASISALAERKLVSETEEINITLYGITGLDSTPTYLWLDEDRKFFGVDYGWFGVTPKGWESHLNVLKGAQEEATDAFFQQLALDLTRPVTGQLVVKGARIFDSINGVLTEPATVFIWKGKFSAIYFDPIAIPEDASVIDARGKTIMPSLWDMHGHVSVESYLNYLASGVTSVRDMANDPEQIYKLGDDVRSGKIIGPDIYALGFIDKRGEFSAPTGKLADSQEDAISLVDFYAQRGFHGIKLYSSIEPEWVAPIARYAHERDLVVMGHVPAYMNARQAIDAGYDEITHINMILLNFLGAEKLDTRTPTRFEVPGEKAAGLDLDSTQVREFVALMKNKGIAHDPTLAIFMDMFLNEPGKVSHVFRQIADHLPANIRRGAIAGTGRNAGQEEIYAKSAQRMQEMLLLMHNSGIRLLPGTDNSLPGFTLIRELMYYVEAGIPANEALQLATIESARHLGQDQRLGSVTVGKDAHFFIVNGDPTVDISALYKVEQVVKGRQMFNAPEVLKAQGFRPFD
jgi:imidazolonepropionase-like amidohydrolase